MAWCPSCKNEYVEGITRCPDCQVDLVAELPLETKEEPLEIPEDYTFPEDFDPRKILEPKKAPEPAKIYRRPEDRYGDMRSSAWTFLSLGVAGLLLSALSWAGIIHLPLHNFALAVMTALFLVFIGVGIASLQNAGKLKANIASENAFTESVIQWYRQEGCKSPALTELSTDQPEELLYFQRSEIIQTLLKEQFPQIDLALLEKLTDDFCEENFNS